MRIFQVGETVAVCRDGKLTQAVEGKIIRTTPKGREISVEFKQLNEEQNGFVEIYPRNNKYGCSCFFEKYKHNKELNIIETTIGDYYTVLPLQDVLDQGYYVEKYDRPAYIEDRDEENRRL